MAALETYLASMFQRLPTNFCWTNNIVLANMMTILAWRTTERLSMPPNLTLRRKSLTWTPIITSHLTAHQLAFVEIKVWSLLKGEKSLPKYDRRREGAIKEYEAIVRKMRTVHSEYVTVCFPSRPLESIPNTSLSNEGSQSQNPYRS